MQLNLASHDMIRGSLRISLSQLLGDTYLVAAFSPIGQRFIINVGPRLL